MPYDISFGGIDLPAHENDFTEHLGSDYEAVGSAVMPGAPAPLSTYDITINVYGDPTETDPAAVGKTKRTQLRALLQNPAARFAGLQLASVADPDLDGWLVVGTADISYGDSGVGFGDFQLQIRGAAWLPAAQSLVGLRLLVQDRNAAAVPLDTAARYYRAPAATGPAEVVHQLPPGALHVRGQAGPVTDTEEYPTLWGKALAVVGRPHGEVLRYQLPFAEAGRGDVHVWDTQLDSDPAAWVRVYGPMQPLTPGVVPALENGVCRLRHLHGSTFAYDVADGKAYQERGHISLGYGTVVLARVTAWTPDRAVVAVELAGGQHDTGVAYVALERGWQGPQVDVYHQGAHRPLTAEGYRVYGDTEPGWDHAQLGATQARAQVATGVRRLVGHR